MRENIMSDNGYRCGHAACQCTTLPEGSQYCSDYCRDAATRSPPSSGVTAMVDQPCGCGHAVCESNPAGDLKDGSE
jgi:hypothetical protein